MSVGLFASQALAISPFISELHYDNSGTDTGESIEITADAGTDLSAWQVVLYNGNGGGQYNSDFLGTISSGNGTLGTYVLSYPSNGIQNGSPDGIALVDGAGNVVEFISYEGAFTASNGPAAGLGSNDIGVAESSSTMAGESLKCVAGTWQAPAAASFGALNGEACEPLVPIRPEPPKPVRISEIQGVGDVSPLLGEKVMVEAVVVGDFQNNDSDLSRELRGFYVQEEDVDNDGDLLTSEGIFVFDGSRPAVDVEVGDRVLIEATVEEYFGETQLNAAGVTVVSSGNILPTPAVITLPTKYTTLSQNGRVQPDLEAHEGMLVWFENTMTVNEMYQLDRFNEIRMVAGDRPVQFTQSNQPDVGGYMAHLQDLGARQIVYDDGLNVQNALIGNLDGFGPVYSTATNIRMGDRVEHLTGILSYQWAGNSASGGTWRVRSVADGDNVFVKVNERPEATPDVGGRIRVATFNVLNYFTTLANSGELTDSGLEPRGAYNEEEFQRQTEKLVIALRHMDADIVALVELENSDTDEAVAYLVDALNLAEGGYDWRYVATGLVGDDAITTGFIYRNSRVRAVGWPAVLDSDAFLDPNASGQSRNRPAVAQAFEAKRKRGRFVAVVNHFKSKGPSGLDTDASVSPEDDDMLDGQGYWNDTRTQAAQILADWINNDPTGIGDPDVLLLGDLNAYANEDPVSALRDAGYTDLADACLGNAGYSYVFDGQIGTLDYAFASRSLLKQVTGVAEWHINADEPDANDYNTDFGRDKAIFDGTTPVRSSDHDPVIVGLDLTRGKPRSWHATKRAKGKGYKAQFVCSRHEDLPKYKKLWKSKN